MEIAYTCARLESLTRLISYLSIPTKEDFHGIVNSYKPNIANTCWHIVFVNNALSQEGLFHGVIADKGERRYVQ